MKKIFIVILVAANCTAFASDKKISIPSYPPDSTIVNQILALNLASYIGKPIDSLLAMLPHGQSTRDFMPLRIGKTRGVTQSYFTSSTNNCFVEIYIDTFNFLPVPNVGATTTWDWTLAKKETIAFIKVYKNSYTCVYGCSNPNYYYP